MRVLGVALQPTQRCTAEGVNVLYTILIILLIVFLALLIWRMVAGRRAI
jgi:hypothetical protein